MRITDHFRELKNRRKAARISHYILNAVEISEQ